MEPLQLSDIIHSGSPSPGPLPNHNSTDRKENTEYESLTEADINRMRSRVAEMGFSLREQPDATAREKELVEMVRFRNEISPFFDVNESIQVFRLTESTLLDPSQLIHQAAIISGLTAQRDYLVMQIEDEREHWSSQRFGWERMAEALISQHNRSSTVVCHFSVSYRVRHITQVSQDPERHGSSSEVDNRALREKVIFSFISPLLAVITVIISSYMIRNQDSNA